MPRPLSNVDAAWLRMDDPTNLMMVTGLLLFDEPLEPERLRSVLRSRLLSFDRFRARVVDPPWGLGSPQWQEDPNFNLDDHLVRLRLPAPADQAALEEAVSRLMSTPLDMSKPLWQVHLIEGYAAGPVVLARLHHCIADGIALIQLLLSLTDEERQPKRRRQVPKRATAGSLARLAGGLSNPRRLAAGAWQGVALASSLAQLVLLPPDPQTILRGPLGTAKRAAWSQRFSLAAIKRAGVEHGATINDVLVTAVAGSLRRYLISRRQPVADLQIRAAVPVNLRPLEQGLDLGNSFGLVFLPLPLSIADPWERLAELKARMDGLKGSAQALVAYGVLHGVGVMPKALLPRAVGFFGSKATAVLTNVPGPRQPLFLAGSRLGNVMFWVPQSGRLGLGVSILSYAGGVMLGVAADSGLIRDPGAVVAGFEKEIALLTGSPRRAGR